MKNLTYFLFRIIPLIVPVASLAQKDTIYLVKNLPDGTLRNEGEFKVVSASAEGILVLHYGEGSILTSKGNYTDRTEEVKTGEWTYYFEDGKIDCKQQYKNGLSEGVWMGYYPSGELYYTEKYKRGKLKEEKYFNKSSEEVPKETVYLQPEFPGGESELYSYLAKNVRYPETAKDAGITGTVYLQFIVNENGSISEKVVVRSAHPLLDEEALRAIGSMPRWKPGILYGEVADMSFRLPIRFTLR